MKALVFDLETTGLVTNGTIRDELFPEIVEYCGIVVNLATGVQGLPLSMLVKPKRKLPEKVVEITGITDAMLEAAPAFCEVAMDVLDQIMSVDVVISHNLSFEKEVTTRELNRCGIELHLWPRGICTVEQTVHLKGYRMNQGDLFEHLFNEKVKEAHRAEADVQTLIRIAVELFKRRML